MSFPVVVQLSDLDGANGFRIEGNNSYDRVGSPVAPAGDFNGDGIADVFVGATLADPGGRVNAGESYVIFGHTGPFVSVLPVTTLDGVNGFRLGGIDPSDNSVHRTVGTGDINGDGLSDLIIGAGQADPDGRDLAGETYVVFGHTGSFVADFNFSSLDGSNGFRLDGIDSGDYAGSMVAEAGDVNGDGIDDLIIGGVKADPNGQINAGESYVVFGHTGSFASTFALSSLDGSNGFRLDGIDAGDLSGWLLARAGDVNGDGVGDLIIGAFYGDPNGQTDAGEAYVVFGHTGSFASALALSSLDGSNGYRLDGIDAGDTAGFVLAGAGDVNGDGLDDIIIGARFGDPNGHDGAGESYVVFGRTGAVASSLALSALDGTNGFRLDGINTGDYSGVAVNAAGDVNGDGIADLIVGAR